LIVAPCSAQPDVFGAASRQFSVGAMILGAKLKGAGFNVRIIDESVLGRRIGDSDMDADWLCLTLMTPTAPRGYEIADRFRSRNPRGRVAIGGIHPSLLPDECVPRADVVVQGEAEEVIVDLLRSGSSEKLVQGARLEDLDSIPLMDYSLLEGAERVRFVPLITSRGCPFNCAFCSCTSMFGHKHRRQSGPRVIEELKRVPEGAFVTFSDDNLLEDRARFDAILNFLVSDNRRRKWSCSARVTQIHDESLAEKMAAAGCMNVTMGIEALDSEALEGMNKKQSPDDIRKAVRILRKHNIPVTGMFIFGWDSHSRRVFDDVARFCDAERLTTFVFWILTPLPCTRVRNEMESAGRILTNDWRWYDLQHAVFKPKQMSQAELQSGMLDAYSRLAGTGSMLSCAFGFFSDIAENGLSARAALARTIGRLRFRLGLRNVMNQWKENNGVFLESMAGWS